MSKKTNPFYEKWDEIVEYLWDNNSPILKMEMKGEVSIRGDCGTTIMITLDESLNNGVGCDDEWDEDDEEE
jgi:hypothetical protein